MDHFPVAAEGISPDLVQTSPGLDTSRANEKRAFQTRRQHSIKWNGWGYTDTAFALNDQEQLHVSGSRYALSGQAFPIMKDWVEESLGVRMADLSPSQPKMEVDAPVLHGGFLKDIKGQHKFISFDDDDRVMHAHGQTIMEMYELRHGKLDRVPDCVVWPETNEHCEAIVKAAHKHNVVVIPFGGGTNVTNALLLNKNETRMIVSLDTTEMDKIVWVNHDNMTARIQCGIIGQDLERKLAEHGVCTGHEPDSMEFSSLGGWIATRASGMKKNEYGNIEDIVVTSRLVTPMGTVERACAGPRVSCGPDINEMVMGSEGMFGVFTECTVRIKKIPTFRRYGSIVFPDFDRGLQFMRDCAMNNLAPASLRLIDNAQFHFSRSMKTEHSSYFNAFVEKVKNFYVMNIKGFDPTQLVVATVLFEGQSEEDIIRQEQALYPLAENNDGMKAGEENGKRGYFLTFVIAYLRDMGLEHYVLGESFETSVPWNKTKDLCRNVKDAIKRACAERGIMKPIVMSRVSQVYDCGACCYFYFFFTYKGMKDPIQTYHEVEDVARDEVLANGGSISHHHGVGKLRKKWVRETITDTGISMVKALKDKVDPKNVFALDNLI